MDDRQFDTLARALGSSASRRAALRAAGATAAASVLAAVRPLTVRAAVARQVTATPYVVVRQYRPSAAIADLQKALGQGYAPLLAQQAGFIEYTVFDNGSGVTSISVFATKENEAAATNQLANWVSQNLASLLPNPSAISNGAAFVHVANQAAFCPAPPSGPTPTSSAGGHADGTTDLGAGDANSSRADGNRCRTDSNRVARLHRSFSSRRRLRLYHRDAESLRRHNAPLLRQRRQCGSGRSRHLHAVVGRLQSDRSDSDPGAQPHTLHRDRLPVHGGRRGSL
jgi:hypothetical protein